MQTRRVIDTGSLQGRKSDESLHITRAAYGLDPYSEDLGRLPLYFAAAILALSLLAMVSGGTEFVAALWP